MSRIYNEVAGNNPPKNLFDLSHSHFLTMRVGLLYPVMCMECYPGDVFDISDAVHCELQPMVAPLMTDLDLYAHTFFVPYRLIYGVDTFDGKSIWEKFITGGEDGDYNTPLPSWSPTWSKTGFTSETIWDSIGNPVKYVAPTGEGKQPTWSPLVPKGLMVSKAPKLSYNFIWNEWYRDENLQEEISLENENLLFATWKKDYFTSAFESQQFGTPPAIPISGIAPVVKSVESRPFGLFGDARRVNALGLVFTDTSEATSFRPLAGSRVIDSNAGSLSSGTLKADGTVSYDANRRAVVGITGDFLDNAVVDFSDASTFNVSDLRLAFAIQRLLELSMTGGHRYTEYLQAHFGASPTDARLDRPEYVGGCRFPVTVSATVQTSETASSPQGNKAGIGNINEIEHIGNYRVQEFGLIMTLVSIRPKPCYSQGIRRNWLRQTRFDYYHPEFANLSEQAIYRAELYVDPTDSTFPDNGVFGYQAHWNELRSEMNYVSGAMREQFDYWTMTRKFGSRPALNADLISLDHPAEYNRVWAVQNEDQFIVAWSNVVRAYRPIPAIGTPGLIDHVYGGL
nr:major head protein [Microvirus sp.]